MNDNIAPVLGRVPSGVFILTVRHNVQETGMEQETGMLASWVMQAGFDPPTLTVAVKKGRYVEQWLQEKAPFNLNILGEGQGKWMSHFGSGFEPGQDAFENLEISRCKRNVPILTGILGHLECEPYDSVCSEDHRIILAKVTGGNLAQEIAPFVHVRKSGAHY